MLNLINFLKKHEGFRDNSYFCEAGRRTIGYGFAENNFKNFTEFYFKNNNITEQEATEVLKKICLTIKSQIIRKVNIELKEHEVDALISLVYNIGIKNFETSTLLKLINENNLKMASLEFLKWNKITKDNIKIQSYGLTKRRMAEKLLFDEGKYA